MIFGKEGGSDREEGQGLVESQECSRFLTAWEKHQRHVQLVRIHGAVPLVCALSTSNNVSITAYIKKQLNMTTLALREREGLFVAVF